MKRVVSFVAVTLVAAGAVAIAQSNEANSILADARSAMGADKLATVESLVATGRLVKFTTGAATDPADFEMAMQLPDKFFRKDVVAVLGDNVISRTSGFNGDGLIDAMDVPPNIFGASGGGGGGSTTRTMVRSTDGTMSFGTLGGPPSSPEATAASRKANILAAKQDFARLTLGLFASSFSGYPLEFAMDTPATSADGKSSVIVVKGEGDFVARLYVDRESHLPVMLTWMAKEPLSRSGGVRMGGPGAGGGTAGSAGGSSVVTSGGGAVQTFSSGQAMSPEDRAQMMKDMEAQMKEAEARRRVVEYQMAYGEYRVVNGLKMPSRLRRTIDGKNADELVLQKITLNAKIDPKKFDIAK